MGAIIYGVRGMDPNLPKRRKPRPKKPAPPPPEGRAVSLVSGAGFAVFGRPHRLRIDHDPTAPPIALEPGPSGYLRLRADQDEHTIIDWYRALLTADLARSRMVRELMQRLQVEPRVVVAELAPGTWCRYDGRSQTVTLHWALAQYDRVIAYYGLVHALVHATRPPGSKHGPHFRSKLQTACVALHASPAALDKQLRDGVSDVWLGRMTDTA
ncbi:YgjP-like metallopeptidase domain-containing protein [Spirillospora sp. NPDC127200]